MLSDVEPGTTVIAREIRTVEGFVLDGTPQKILIKDGEVQSLTFWNKRDNSLTILKQSTDLSDHQRADHAVDGDFTIPVRHIDAVAADLAVFIVDGVIGSSTLTQNGIFTTDAQGEIRISNLAPGA